MSSLYSTLVAKTMPCARCHVIRPATEVQFFSADDSLLPVYQEGEVIPAPRRERRGTPPTLASQAPFNGYVDNAYCVPCHDRFEGEKMAAVAAAAERGDVVCRLASDGGSGDALGREAVLAALEAAQKQGRERAVKLGFAATQAHLTLLAPASTGLSITREGRELNLQEPSAADGLVWWNALLDRTLRAAGWPFGQDCSREDVLIQVDAENRITLEVPPADRPAE